VCPNNKYFIEVEILKYIYVVLKTPMKYVTLLVTAQFLQFWTQVEYRTLPFCFTLIFTGNLLFGLDNCQMHSFAFDSVIKRQVV
jgi:hypothetical protein